eukprot:516511_1
MGVCATQSKTEQRYEQIKKEIKQPQMGNSKSKRQISLRNIEMGDNYWNETIRDLLDDYKGNEPWEYVKKMAKWGKVDEKTNNYFHSIYATITKDYKHNTEVQYKQKSVPVNTEIKLDAKYDHDEKERDYTDFHCELGNDKHDTNVDELKEKCTAFKRLKVVLNAYDDGGKKTCNGYPKDNYDHQALFNDFLHVIKKHIVAENDKIRDHDHPLIKLICQHKHETDEHE